MATSEHELLKFVRVKKALDKVNDGMEVISTGILAESLGKLGGFPYAKTPCYYDCDLSIAGKSAGSLKKPNVDSILRESTPSSFGKGETTVLDLTYRNGKEIPAEKIDVGEKFRYFSDLSQEEISIAMFVGKHVKLKLYKLAVYEEGGHFDWHMDSTHSDQHHATVLLALNTAWEGGELKLRRNGVETVVDMHPKAEGREGPTLQAIAFYTDTEHKVEPVTKSIRIVLQYDVEVGGDRKIEWPYDDYVLCDNVESTSKRRKYQKAFDSLEADNATVKKVTDVIAGMLADGAKEVAFAMQFLYRKSSILPEFLKGADAQLHRALVETFNVTLQPVVLKSRTGTDGSFESCVAVPWNAEVDTESDSGSEVDRAHPVYFMRAKKEGTFHLPMHSAIRKISHKDYLEHTGNEAQRGEMKYFGGGMFVRRKTE